MEQVLGLIGLVMENWELLLAIASVAVSAGAFLRKRQWRQAAEAFAYVGHIAYSAIEEGGEEYERIRKEGAETAALLYANPEGPLHVVKRRVEDAVTAMGEEDNLITAAENMLRMKVDPKGDVPPIKRFWRRFLSQHSPLMPPRSTPRRTGSRWNTSCPNSKPTTR